MAVAGLQSHAVESLELLNLLQCLWREGRFALKGVKHDSFQQVAKRHVLLLGNGFEYFEHALFHSYAGLYAFDFEGLAFLFLL